jgi:hypothetical protein
VLRAGFGEADKLDIRCSGCVQSDIGSENAASSVRLINGSTYHVATSAIGRVSTANGSTSPEAVGRMGWRSMDCQMIRTLELLSST